MMLFEAAFRGRRRAACGAATAIFSIEYVTSRMRSRVRGVRFAISDIKCQTFGIPSLIFDILFSIFDITNETFGIRFDVFDMQNASRGMAVVIFIGWTQLVGDLVNGVAERDLDVLPEREPRRGFGMFLEECVVIFGVELDALPLREFLRGGIDPLLSVLEKGAAVHELRLLRVLSDAGCAGSLRGRRGCITAIRFRNCTCNRAGRLFRKLESILAARIRDAIVAFLFVFESGPRLGHAAAHSAVRRHLLQRALRKRNATAVFIFNNQIRRVRSDDSISARELARFIAQIISLAVQANFIE